MAPKRGLKASKGKSSAPPPPEAEDIERSYPTDGDSLTIPDLFELRSSILALVLLPSPTQDQLDEASNLLRGVLHGCDALVAISAAAAKTAEVENHFFEYSSQGKDEVVKEVDVRGPFSR